MLANYFAAAWRNLGRNRLQAGVTIAGLALAFAASILIAIYLNDELSYDRFWPKAESLYALTETQAVSSFSLSQSSVSSPDIGPKLVAAAPQVSTMTRMVARHPLLSNGPAEAVETLEWVDPNFFQLFPMKVLSGRLNGALDQPDSIVITHKLARKYFSSDAVAGRLIGMNPANDTSKTPSDHVVHPMRITAVVADLPSETILKGDAFASLSSALGPMAHVTRAEHFATFVRLRAGPGGYEAQGQRVAAVLPAIAASTPMTLLVGAKRILHLLPLVDMHLHGPTGALDEQVRQRRMLETLTVLGVLAAVIVAVASINFVTLMTARAAERATEVGLRKAVGARRRDLIVQFMGEAMIYVVLALVVGGAMAELTLPALDRLLMRTMSLDHPKLIVELSALAVAVGLLAGLYPALVLSSFRPVQAFRGRAAAGSAGVRQGLVVLQFTILAILILVTATLWRQSSFTLKEASKLAGPHLLSVNGYCTPQLLSGLRATPGVSGVMCSPGPIQAIKSTSHAYAPDGTPLRISFITLNPGEFEFYGIRPLVGRLFPPSTPGTFQQERIGLSVYASDKTHVVINQQARRLLGYATDQAAVGRMVTWANDDNLIFHDTKRPAQILGVVPDSPTGGLDQAQAWYLTDKTPEQESEYSGISVRLDGNDIPGTIRRIDAMWRGMGHPRPLDHKFEEDLIRNDIKDIRELTLITGAAGLVAMIIACLGMFALSAFTTARRTKEIGVRKALGARTRNVLALLLGQFAVPVIVANLIAWPVAWLWGRHLLETSAVRVGQPLWLFLAVGAGSLLLAWAVVLVHAQAVARAKPATALRYE